MNKRVTGFDVARALAIFGMVIVNFKIAMNTESDDSPFLNWFTCLFEGRASALFVVLAGIGITFLTNKARLTKDSNLLSVNRKSIIKRGLFLIAIGLAYVPLWPADILHFYGFYFLIAAFMFSRSDEVLLWTAGLITALFPVLVMVIDYEQGWNWNTLTYNNFWTADGMVRHILFNGFHPVIPWSAFLLFGIWLGRQPLTSSTVQRKLGAAFFTTWAVTESCTFLIRQFAGNGSTIGMTSEDVQFLFSTSIMPPLPQYIIAAGSLAGLVIVGCLYLTASFPASKLLNWLHQTGQLSLSLYVAHVLIGMGALEAAGYLENQTIGFSLLCALIFSVLSIVFSVIWLKYFKTGPLEWVFRRAVGE